jgi:hypothetical protein
MPSSRKKYMQKHTVSENNDTSIASRADSFGRIRTPHDNDILCGRGGSINSHPGNRAFREWVYTRKSKYNLASTKIEKSAVVDQVLDLVRGLKPPGRFLQKQRDEDGQDEHWVEIDDAKAMAKISQALREGAPAMRAAHGKTSATSAKRRQSDSSIPSQARRQSKRRVKKRRYEDLVLPEVGTSSSSRLKPEAALPLTPPPSPGHHDLMDNHDYSYLYHSEELPGLLEHSHQTSAASGMHTEPGDLVGGESTPLTISSAPFISPGGYSHPLIPFGDDYRVHISEVANAIPPSLEKQSSRANNVTPTLTSRPSPFMGIDPLSFLPSTPVHAPRTSVNLDGMDGQTFFPLTPITAVPTSPNDEKHVLSPLEKQSVVQREHSLDAASLGSFSNPLFEQSLEPLPRGFSFGTNNGSIPKAKISDTFFGRTSSGHSSLKSLPSSNPSETKRPFKEY